MLQIAIEASTSKITTVIVLWLHKYHGMAAMAPNAVTVAMVNGLYDKNDSIS